MISTDKLLKYVLRLADDRMIISHRLTEMLGKAPILEEEMASANVALDLLGEANQLYKYAGELEGKGNDADHFPMKRFENQFTNVLLVEQANHDFATVIMRQFLWDAFDYFFTEALCNSNDETLKGVGEKAVKENSYHLRHSADWMRKLGDGTEESHNRLQAALDYYWSYTGELFEVDDLEKEIAEAGIGPDLNSIKEKWMQIVKEVITESTLTIPDDEYMHSGGRIGRHTEALGHILSELQYLQRAYPGAEW